MKAVSRSLSKSAGTPLGRPARTVSSARAAVSSAMGDTEVDELKARIQQLKSESEAKLKKITDQSAADLKALQKQR